MTEQKLLYADLTGKIIGAAMEVHTILGPGFLEAVYEEALAHEFGLRAIPFERQKTFSVPYKTISAGVYRPDFVVDSKVIVDTKAIKCLTEIEEAQIINYLKVTGLRVGLVLNFGTGHLEFKRRVL
ncbi:MAG TPA: GxxExxY protein [Anaerolineae bacterium]